jgi:proteasome-associated ATPase
MTTPKDDFGDLYGSARRLNIPLGLGSELAVPQAPTPYEQVPRERYEAMQKTLREQDKILKQLSIDPQIVGLVLAVRDERTYIAGPNGPLMVRSVPGITEGKQVFIHSGTNAIIGAVPVGELPPIGLVSTIERSGAAWTVRLESGERTDIVPDALAPTLVHGDRVVVDAASCLVLANLGKAESRHKVDHAPLHWDEIGGCTEAKEAIRQAIEYPVTHAALYAAYGKKPSRGVLLHGSPGNGKTLLGRAAATAVSGGHGPDPFIYVKGPEVRSKWQGETEANIRRLFDRARAHKQATGRAAVIFIDEADALLAARDTGGLASSSNVDVVAQFLAEMDGLQDSSAFILLSTNLPTGLDPAVVRDERIDRKVHVPRPDRAAATAIFQLKLRGQLGDTVALAAGVLELIYSDDVVVHTAQSLAGPLTLHLKDVLSGAVIAGIVNRALENALERDRLSNITRISGLNSADLRHGVFLAARELASTNLHQDFIAKLQASQTTGN